MKSMTDTKTANLIVQTNITDPIQDELDQRVFKGTTPRPTQIEFVYKHFMDTMREILDEPEKYIDLYLTGSLTTYQYSDNSDFDVSVFPNYNVLPAIMNLPDANAVRKVLVAHVIDKIDGVYLPGTSHPCQHFVVLPTNTLDELYKPGLRSAWSFQTKSWVVPPEKERATNIQKELPLMFWRAKQMAEKMRLALRTDPDAAKRLFMRIHNKRTQDQRAGRGDFSEGNIIYKWLLHEGLFDELKNIGVYIAKTADQDRIELWKNPDEEMIETLMIPFWRGSTPEEVFEQWKTLVEGVPEDVIWDTVQNVYRQFLELKQENDARAAELKRQLDEHFAKPPNRNWRWAWYEGRVIADECGDWDSELWQRSRVHEELIDALGVPIEALMEHDMGDLQQDRADDVYLGYAELQENGEFEFEHDSYDMGYKEAPVFVQNDVIEYIKMNWPLEKVAEVKSMQVIYNFQEDRIILGTTAMAAHLPHTVVVGEYRDGEVILNQGSHQWLNTTYFKKLWAHSYPTYPLKGVHVRHEDGPKKVGDYDAPPAIIQPAPVQEAPAWQITAPGMDSYYQITEPGDTPPAPIGSDKVTYRNVQTAKAATVTMNQSRVTSGHTGVWLGVDNGFNSLQAGIIHYPGEQPMLYWEVVKDSKTVHLTKVAPYILGAPVNLKLMNNRGVWSIVMNGKKYGSMRLGTSVNMTACGENRYTDKPNKYAITILPQKVGAIEHTPEGLRLERLDEPYEFKIPDKVLDIFKAKAECPQCGNHMLRDPELYCPYCGYTFPKTAAALQIDWVEVPPTDANGYAVLYLPEWNQVYIGTPYAHHYQVIEALDNQGVELDHYEEAAYVNGKWYWYSNPWDEPDELDPIAQQIVDEIRRDPHLAKTSAPLYDGERGNIYYREAFVRVGPNIVRGGTEHWKLMDFFVDKLVDNMTNQGYQPKEAEQIANYMLEDAIPGHIGEELGSDMAEGQVWAVFSSDVLNFGDIERNEINETVEMLKRYYPNIKEGDEYVYKFHWYQGDAYYEN